MKKLFTFLLFALCFSISHAQIEFYKSYEDYTSNTSVQFKDFRLPLEFATNVEIYVKTFDGKNDRVLIKDYWGFKYKNRLFRLSKNNIPFCLVSQGKICYYENGIAYIDALYNNKKTGKYAAHDGKFSFSKTLDSPMSFGIYMDGVMFPHAKFFVKTTEFNTLYKFLLQEFDDYIKKHKATEYREDISYITTYMNSLEFDFVRKHVFSFNQDNDNQNTIEMKFAKYSSKTRVYEREDGKKIIKTFGSYY